MNSREAYAQGLSYTGISWPSWSIERANEAKVRIAGYRKKYNVRFAMVKEADGYMSYYASKGWHLITHGELNLDEIKERYQKSLAKLKAEYEEKVQAEQAWYEHQLADYEQLQTLRK